MKSRAAVFVVKVKHSDGKKTRILNVSRFIAVKMKIIWKLLNGTKNQWQNAKSMEKLLMAAEHLTLKEKT